jgi:acyl-CoA synthetase (NDP forming)
VVASLLGPVGAEVASLLRQAEVVAAADPDEAVKCLSWLYGFARPPLETPPAPAAAGRRVEPCSDWRGRMALLAAADIMAPRWAVVPAEAEPAGLVAELRFPLVAKALPDAGEHKTDRGLVKLDLRTTAQLDAAVGELRAKLGAGASVLVQEMCPGGLEVLVAARRDADFGPVLAVGTGGVLTEWQADVGYVPLPASEAEIEDALSRLRIRALFEPYRGVPRRDLPAFLAAARRLGDLYVAQGRDGWEIEINPLLVFEEGRGVAAVDVLCAPQREGAAR